MTIGSPKFLLNGVNYKQAFIGLRTAQTGVYGCIEMAIKVAPIFIAVYGIKAATTHYTPERDEFLDETARRTHPAEIKRESF